jgi:hypothetical protein
VYNFVFQINCYCRNFFFMFVTCCIHARFRFICSKRHVLFES